MDRCAVQGIEVYAVFDNHSCQSGTIDEGSFSVRDSNTLADSGGAFLFPSVNFLTVGFPVVDLAALDHQIHHLIQCFLLRSRCPGQGNASLVE